MHHEQHLNGFFALFSFTHPLCNLYNTHIRLCDISKTRTQKTRKWNSYSRIINPLFNGLTYNMREHFAHCSYFSLPAWGLENTKQLPIHLCILGIILNHQTRCIYFSSIELFKFYFQSMTENHINYSQSNLLQNWL